MAFMYLFKAHRATKTENCFLFSNGDREAIFEDSIVVRSYDVWHFDLIWFGFESNRRTECKRALTKGNT